MRSSPIEVVVWGTYDTGKPRSRILLAGLAAQGVTVREVHQPVWDGVEDKSQATGVRARLALAWRWSWAYPRLVWRYLRAPAHDVVLVAYLGVVDVLVLWPFARVRGVPIVWDAFLSLYDTVVDDRKMVPRGGLVARGLHALEWLASRAADRILIDTDAHASWWAATFGLPRARVGTVWVGAEDTVFGSDVQAADARDAGAEPADRASAGAEGRERVALFYGQCIPLHGIETIVRAAALARDAPLRWVIVGSGQEAPAIDALLERLALDNVERHGWVPYDELATWIRRADVCLGIFGTSAKASRVIPNKVFQVLAMGAPLITRDGPAIRELLDGTEPGVALVPPGDPAALVAAVERMVAQPRSRTLHADLRERIRPDSIGRQLVEQLHSVLTDRTQVRA